MKIPEEEHLIPCNTSRLSGFSASLRHPKRLCRSLVSDQSRAAVFILSYAFLRNQVFNIHQPHSCPYCNPTENRCFKPSPKEQMGVSAVLYRPQQLLRATQPTQAEHAKYPSEDMASHALSSQNFVYVSDLKFSVIQDMRSLGHSHVLPQLLISILFCNHFEQISSCANIYSCNSLAFCSRARGQEPCTIHLCYERYAWICSLMSCANSFFPPLYLAIKLHI